MCETCGCTAAADSLSKVERIKADSNRLRGDIETELGTDSAAFSDSSMQLLKFHGVYQQEDRDRRKEARRLGLAKHHQMMVRTRIPGGVVSADAYLAHDRIAERWGNGTMRITTRQDFQLHGILKGDLRSSIREINDALLTTLGGCGDVERNIMCCAAPIADRFRAELGAVLAGLVTELTPHTGAYHQIWLDGELAVDSRAGGEAEPLYGDRYLPRKFKTAIALDGDNCVDVHANDLGLVAHRDAEGGLAGFTALVGGGLGRTRNKPDTFAAVAQPLGSVSVEQVVALSRAVIEVQRDHGNRADRRHARLKYLLAERGLPWFREQVQERLDFALDPPRTLSWPRVEDHLGWHQQGDGNLFFGLHVENGRVADTPGHALRAALRELVETLRPELRLTPLQNVIVTGVSPAQRARVESILTAHGVELPATVPPLRRLAMACPAIPTCGLAVAESERVLPELIRDIERVAEEAGLAGEPISVRMTGCPNGCARPYLGDVGLVGTTLGKYDVFLGGDPAGTHLNWLYAPALPLGSVCDLLRPLLGAFAAERAPGEAFGSWCDRLGAESLRGRFGAPQAAAADDAVLAEVAS
ncbi:MAG TPA: NADPH-dependent assimilatory sulfite reductase hemoprotein subunit [Candidatus Dormibacteraeota bacterium]|nr:NADPH-dependent assimilatory sulfite reductase hemoprotein subunit [Candidatus Dormibacteraeota bacterium]